MLKSIYNSRYCEYSSTPYLSTHPTRSVHYLFFVSPTCLGLRGNAAAVMLMVSGMAVTGVGGTFTTAAVVIPVCTSLVVFISVVRRQRVNFFFFHLCSTYMS